MTRDEAMADAIDMICEAIHERLAGELEHMLAQGAGIEECLAHLEKRRDDLKRFRQTTMPRLWCAIVHGATLQ
jgi:hypothetical protein